MMTIAHHFAIAFPHHSLEAGDLDALKSMPSDSNCGADCIKAIDAAKAFADQVTAAWGPDGYPGERIAPDDIAHTAAQVCATFICG
jgi:hypothetical protein